MSIDQLLWEWVPRGVPWWKPAEELEAELRACGAGIDTPQKICRRHGSGDFYRNLRELKKAKDFAASLGLSLEFGNPSAPFTIVTQPAEA
jgi:capsid protein